MDRYAASVVMSLAYGKATPTSYSDPEVLLVNKCLTRLTRAQLPGRYLVDSYPILRYVPGYPKDMYETHKEELGLYRSQLEIVRKKMASAMYSQSCFICLILVYFFQLKAEAHPCFAKYILEKQNEYGLSDNELAYLAGSMFGAGSDTVR